MTNNRSLESWDRKRFWPYEVLPSEQRTEQHHCQIAFLETAQKQGYSPYTFGSNFGATSEQRSAEIICRGRRWEIFLDSDECRILSAFIDDFPCSADAVLKWLNETDVSMILEMIRPHLWSHPGNPAGFVLHESND